MAAMSGLQFFCLAFIVTLFVDGIVAGCSKGVQGDWIPISHPSHAVRLMPEPAGILDGNDLFVCKGYTESGGWWKPGEFYVTDNKVSCWFLHYGVHSTTKFEMLKMPRGSLSWIPYDPELPLSATAVVAGYKAGGGTEYPEFVCRAVYKGHLLIGTIAWYTKVLPDSCWIAFEGTEQYVRALEILVLNAYGMKLYKDRCFAG